MIAIVVLALALLGLTSCQWGLVSPERQPEPLNAEERGAEARLAAVRPEPLSLSSKTARQYVREGYRLLLVGKAQEARRALRAALRQAPQNKQAAMLLQQIEDDPEARFGPESFPYRIRPNDTLTGLAQRFLGDALQFYTLAKYNDVPNPSRIAAGQILKIPGKPPKSETALQVPPEPAVALPPAVAEPIVPPVDAPPAPLAAASSPVIEQPPVPQPDTSPTSAPKVEAEPTVVPTGRYYAVVIGIDAYTHLGELDTAVTDAMAVTQILEAQYGFDAIFLPDATRANILEVLDNLRAILTPQDSLLIYYAGRGVLDEDKHGYWLLQDASPDSRSGWLATSKITEHLKAMAARHVMVVADSCYSGTQDRNGTDDSSAAGGLRQADLYSRTVIASGSLEPVIDPDGGQLSVFAEAFLTTLYTNREVLKGQQLFASMQSWLIASSFPTPVYADLPQAEHRGGDFWFVPRR